MQILKPELKAAILHSALNEFEKRGFEEASMRVIAKEAKMTVGNLYRYFKNKEDLFDQIMAPAWQEFSNIVSMDIGPNGRYDIRNFSVEEIAYRIISSCEKYRQQFWVLLTKSKGSKYENAKQWLVELVETRINGEMLPLLRQNDIEVEDTFISHLLAIAVIEGFLSILQECGQDTKRMRKLTERYLILLLQDLIGRIGQPLKV